MSSKIHELVVIGAGPGGYAAAFRASDLGIKVTLIEKDNQLGGVCLNRGCIPSKALLHISKTLNEAREVSKIGVRFKAPQINISKINQWKDDIIKNLSTGIESLAKRRDVKIINGTAKFISASELVVTSDKEQQSIKFKKCIIATGSRSSIIPNIDINHKDVITSKDALNFNSIPDKMLIIGGGYIGLEMATFYRSIGTKIDIVEFQSDILSEMDKELVNVLNKQISEKINVITKTKVTSIVKKDNKNLVFFESTDGLKNEKLYDKILVCVGRKPNTDNLSLDSAGIPISNHGFIDVNSQCRTLIPNIFAIGDITGNPMLAHRATHQGKVAAEVIAGINQKFEPECIPYVIFTDPEIAWVGPSESDLKEKQIDFKVKIFPWQANARAISLGAAFGKTKIIYSRENHKVLSVGIVGSNAGDLIGEAALAIEMGAFVEDLSLTIHPHPTLTETIGNAAEMIEGTITDLYHPKK